MAPNAAVAPQPAVKRLTVPGPKMNASHFWPRLWSTAKPMGCEARQCKQKGVLPELTDILDDIDLRIFVQGGDWVSKHLDLIREDAELGGMQNEAGTCVMIPPGTELYRRARPPASNSFGQLQGVVVRKDMQLSTLTVKFANGADESHVFQMDLQDTDIWWCFPFWVAKSYRIHNGKVNVDAGFYFLAEPGRPFQFNAINWVDQTLYTEPHVDGCRTSNFGWILRRKEDRARVLDFTMFETAGKGNVMQGERFVFEKRQLLDAAGAGLSEDALRTSGSVSLKIAEGVPVRSAKFAENIEAKMTSEQSPKELVAAPVQTDSKWALHPSLAPARGAATAASYIEIPDLTRGQALGMKTAHYREKQWFTEVDLLLQHLGLRETALRPAGDDIVVEQRAPAGRAANSPIDLTANGGGAGPSKEPAQRPKLLKVFYYGNRRGEPAERIVKVPRSDSPAGFKRLAREALADDDIAGEPVKKARLRWTFIDGENTEVDISKLTDATDLDQSPAINVYVESW